MATYCFRHPFTVDLAWPLWDNTRLRSGLAATTTACRVSLRFVALDPRVAGQ